MSAQAVPEPPRIDGGDPCHRIDELIEPYVDGELGDTDRARVARHAARCGRCSDQLALAERVRSGLRELPPAVCPPHVSDTALAHVERRRWRPMLALAAALALAVIGGVVLLRPASTPETAPETAIATAPTTALTTPTTAAPTAAPTTAPAAPTARSASATPVDPAEVARAQADVELALAYLGKIGARTGDIVRHDVLERRVASPVVARVRDALGHES